MNLDKGNMKVQSTVLNNGYATNWFKPSARMRQGSPLSPYLLILTAELMSNKIFVKVLISREFPWLKAN